MSKISSSRKEAISNVVLEKINSSWKVDIQVRIAKVKASARYGQTLNNGHHQA